MHALILAIATAAQAATLPAEPVAPGDVNANPQAPKAIRGDVDRSVTAGGALRIRWNTQFLRQFGIVEIRAARGVTERRTGVYDLALDADARFEVDGHYAGTVSVAGGGGRLTGGFVLRTADGPIRWLRPTFVVRAGAAARIDFVADSGDAWFYADKLMYSFSDDGRVFRLRSADLRITPELAQRLGWPNLAGAYAAELRAALPVVERIESPGPKSCAVPNWPGTPVPGMPGQTYQADVFMTAFDGDIVRLRNIDGPGGASDGELVIAPSSTLRNNVNNGSAVATVPGDPLGTSTALHTAEVPWYAKFQTSPHPYPYPGNDQHPYLIWNLYRFDADGGISQVGASGVKHAFVSINSGCADGTCSFGNILGRACGDTYGTGNNDSPFDLGPRREMIPATGQWGRCGSIYDPNCNGSSEDFDDYDDFTHRMLVRESEIDPAAHPGAAWWFESWYLVRDDVNIYNTMGTRGMALDWFDPPGPPVQFAWRLTDGSGASAFRLGSAIDRWVAPGTTATTSNQELAVAEGHAKVAVRVVDLGGGNFRYHYAVMNFDFARATTQGAEPNLRVDTNRGFGALRILASASSITNLAFSDGDDSAANDWTANLAGGVLTWTAPAGNTLDWGLLYRFSFTANTAPQPGNVVLDVADAGSPANFTVPAFAAGRPEFFADGFENP